MLFCVIGNNFIGLDHRRPEYPMTLPLHLGPPMTWHQRTRYGPPPHRSLRRRSSVRRPSPPPSTTLSDRSIDQDILWCEFLSSNWLPFLLYLPFDANHYLWFYGGRTQLGMWRIRPFMQPMHASFFSIINSTHLVWSVSLWKKVHFSCIDSSDVLHQLFLLSFVLACIPLHLFSFWQDVIVTMGASYCFFFWSIIRGQLSVALDAFFIFLFRGQLLWFFVKQIWCGVW